MKNIILFCCTLVIMQACNEAPKQKVVPVKASSKVVSNDKEVKSSLPMPPIGHYPIDSTYSAYILTPSDASHYDEVDPSYAKHAWVGLFKTDSGYFVKQTKVTIRPTPDEMMDEPGWEVKPSVKDSCLLLVSGLSYLKPRPVEATNLKDIEIMPGKQLEFKYGNINYVLHATGRIVPIEGDLENVIDYQLFLKTVINGKTRDQKLVAVPSFDGTMVNIRFVGDIDGDGRPDLIIDTTDHYNKEQPTLYLSKPAKTGDLLKVVGIHTYIGC